jgi:hypothetical protein
MKSNHVLGIAAAVLLVLSGWTYYDSVTRAERFERGQKFLPNLNPDEIIDVEVVKGDDKVHLRRQGGHYVVVDAESYPASNDSVNRFLRDVLDLALEKRVGKGESLEKELGLESGGEETVEVVFKNSNEKEMVRFLVGDDAGDAGGNFIVRTDNENRQIYLTSSRAYLRASPDDFLKKEIVDVKADDVAAVTGLDFRIVNEDGDFNLEDLASGKKESSKVSSAKYILSGLRFDKHHLADADEVYGLRFDPPVQVELEDDSGYQLEVAEAGTEDAKKYYLRIQAFHKKGELTIARDADDEEVKETAEALEVLDNLAQFNRFHGSWIYEISEGTANKLNLKRSDLMEDA